MPGNVGSDHLAIIRIEGMHCHKCEQTIQRSLSALQGVHEVEVDFNSGQASVLYDHEQLSVNDLVGAVTEAGYRVSGFSQREHATR